MFQTKLQSNMGSDTVRVRTPRSDRLPDAYGLLKLCLSALWEIASGFNCCLVVSLKNMSSSMGRIIPSHIYEMESHNPSVWNHQSFFHGLIPLNPFIVSSFGMLRLHYPVPKTPKSWEKSSEATPFFGPKKPLSLAELAVLTLLMLPVPVENLTKSRENLVN